MPLTTTGLADSPCAYSMPSSRGSKRSPAAQQHTPQTASAATQIQHQAQQTSHTCRQTTSLLPVANSYRQRPGARRSQARIDSPPSCAEKQNGTPCGQGRQRRASRGVALSRSRAACTRHMLSVPAAVLVHMAGAVQDLSTHGIHTQQARPYLVLRQCNCLHRLVAMSAQHVGGRRAHIPHPHLATVCSSSKEYTWDRRGMDSARWHNGLAMVLVGTRHYGWRACSVPGGLMTHLSPQQGCGAG